MKNNVGEYLIWLIENKACDFSMDNIDPWGNQSSFFLQVGTSSNSLGDL